MGATGLALAVAAAVSATSWNARTVIPPLPDALPSVEEAATYAPTDVEVDMAVAILTQPDIGVRSTTVRFTGPIVTYRLELPDYPGDYLAHVRAAFGYAGAITGLSVIEVDGPADIVLTPQPTSSALASLFPAADGSLARSTVKLGCCLVRPVWEDVLQAFGPIGDRSDGRSIFSQAFERSFPSRFDAWVLWMLYTQPSDSTPDELRSAILLHRLWVQGLGNPRAAGDPADEPA